MKINYCSFLHYIKKQGYSTYRLRKEKLVSETTMQKLRHEIPVQAESMQRLCDALGISTSDFEALTNRTFTIIAGLNGSGKSSLTGSIKYERKDLGTIVDVDQLTRQENGDFYVAGQLAMRIMQECMENCENFTQETTLAGAYTRRVAKEAKSSGYRVRMYYVGIDSEEESLRRIKNRVEKGGHDIPADDVHRRWQNRANALHKILPYCDEVVFFDNVNGFVEVGQIREGEFIGDKSNVPQWLKEIL